MLEQVLEKQQVWTKHEWIRETRFGRWFLRSDTWVRYVLVVAINDFASLLKSRNFKVDKLLDAGCGQGLAFPILEKILKPKSIVGVDIDSELLSLASEPANECDCLVSLVNAKISKLDFPDESFDMVFCHQLLHHTGNQVGALKEMYRVMSPGGLLLVGESCISFINSLPVKLLFKHPSESQKTASEFIELVKSCGFIVDDDVIQSTAPWWSLPDLGVLDKLRKNKKTREPSEVLFVARKP